MDTAVDMDMDMDMDKDIDTDRDTDIFMFWCPRMHYIPFCSNHASDTDKV